MATWQPAAARAFSFACALSRQLPISAPACPICYAERVRADKPTACRPGKRRGRERIVDPHVFRDRQNRRDACASTFGNRVADALRRRVDEGDRRQLGKIGDAIIERHAIEARAVAASATPPVIGVPAAIIAATWLRA
jgi:hypothetical protein